jgi:hypothetical protein
MKRLRTGLAASVLAVSLSFGLAAQPAQALTVPPIVAPVLVGGTPAAGGAVATCVASVVCIGAVGIAAAAVGLYATRDTWVPLLAGFFEDGQEEAISSAGGVRVDTTAALFMASVSANVLTYTLVRNTPVGSNSLTSEWYWEMVCRAAPGVYTWASGSTYRAATSGPVTTNFTQSCSTGSVPVGFRTWGPGANTGRYQPLTHVQWGGNGGLASELSTYRATAECVKADGSTETLVVEYQGNPSSVGPGLMIPSCQEAGIGDHAKSVDVDVKLPGRTDFRDAWAVTAPAQPLYPDCDPTMSTGCELRVQVDGTVCAVGDARCLEWMTHAPSRLVCLWGPYTVPLARCDMLERAYQTGGARITEETTDGDPATAPAGSPGTDPGTYPTPVPFPTTVPVPTGPAPVPETGVTVDSGCWPTGTAAWNPLEWVLRPVQCAMVWAFIPETGLEPYTARVMDAWGASPVGTWVGEVGGASATLGGGISGNGGCEGPVWSLPLGGESYRFAPLDACTAPMSSIAPWVKAAVAALTVLAGIKAVSRPVTRSLDLPSAPGA